MTRRIALSVALGAFWTALAALVTFAVGWSIGWLGAAVVFTATAATQWTCFWARDRGSWW